MDPTELPAGPGVDFAPGTRATTLDERELLDLIRTNGLEAAETRIRQLQDQAPRRGTGTPEAVVTAPPGTLYVNLSGGAGTTLYVKESGTGNTGWVAK